MNSDDSSDVTAFSAKGVAFSESIADGVATPLEADLAMLGALQAAVLEGVLFHTTPNADPDHFPQRGSATDVVAQASLGSCRSLIRGPNPPSCFRLSTPVDELASLYADPRPADAARERSPDHRHLDAAGRDQSRPAHDPKRSSASVNAGIAEVDVTARTS